MQSKPMHSASFSPRIQQLSTEILKARQQRQMLSLFTNQYPDFDLASAYEVAHAVHQAQVAAGAVSVGKKIGFTNRALWPVFNVHQPVWGTMYAHTVRHLSASDGQICSLAGMFAPKIEPEIVFHFKAAPAVGSALEDILACVDWVALGFEIVDCPFPDWKFLAPDCTATGALHAQLWVGAPCPVEQLGANVIEALAQLRVELICDGQVRDAGTGANVLGNPLAAVAHLQAVLQSQPYAAPIQSGDLITTGTITQALSISAGQHWQTKLQGLGLADIDVRFTA
jgi:2-keto-4-pentenoate hydratase